MIANKSNTNLTYNKLINILNKSLDDDGNNSLSHSPIASGNVNTVRLSFMSNKDL